MPRPKQPGLTENELSVMKELWSQAPLTVGEILDRLNRRPKPAYTSLLTLVQAMEKKGYITHEKQGKAFAYFPKLQQQHYMKGEIKRVSERLFGSGPLSLVMNLIQTEQLSKDEVEQLKKLLEEK
jgi:BlaI family transcriptional regulator, penicillinase repressor